MILGNSLIFNNSNLNERIFCFQRKYSTICWLVLKIHLEIDKNFRFLMLLWQITEGLNIMMSNEQNMNYLFIRLKLVGLLLFIFPSHILTKMIMVLIYENLAFVLVYCNCWASAADGRNIECLIRSFILLSISSLIANSFPFNNVTKTK